MFDFFSTLDVFGDEGLSDITSIILTCVSLCLAFLLADALFSCGTCGSWCGEECSNANNYDPSCYMGEKDGYDYWYCYCEDQTWQECRDANYDPEDSDSQGSQSSESSEIPLNEDSYQESRLDPTHPKKGPKPINGHEVGKFGWIIPDKQERKNLKNGGCSSPGIPLPVVFLGWKNRSKQKYRFQLLDMKGKLCTENYDPRKFVTRLPSNKDKDEVPEIIANMPQELYPMYLMYARRTKQAETWCKDNKQEEFFKENGCAPKNDRDEWTPGKNGSAAYKITGKVINKEIRDNQKEIELLIYKRLRALIWKDKTGAIAKAKEVEDHVLRHKMSQLRQRDFVWSRLDTLSCYFHFCKLVKEVFEERVIGNSKISKTKLFADWNKHDDMLVQNLKYAGMIENRLGSDNPEEVAEDYKQSINESCPIRMEKIKTSFGEEFNPESESFGKAGGGLLSIEWEKVEEDLEEILIHDGCSSESEDSESSDEEDYETSWSDWLPSFRAVWLSFCLLVAAGVFTTVFWDSVVPDAGFDMV